MKMEVKVVPNSQHSRVVGMEEGVLKVQCKESPQKGQVNRELIALLSSYFKVPKSAIRILVGKTCKRKLIEIEGIE